MKSRMDVGTRLRIASGKLREYGGRLKELEGRLKVIHGQAREASGLGRLQLERLERQLRATIDSTLKSLDGVMKTLEPRVRRSLDQTKAFTRSLQVGIKAGAAAYRQSRRK